jgi:Tfp pilus assembly protein PilN
MALLTRKREDVSINLLPQDVRSTQRTQRYFQFALVGAIAIVVVLIALLVMRRMEISHQEDILREETAKAASLQRQVDALRDVEILKANIDATRAVLAGALAGDINWAKFLDDLDSNWPGNATLTSVSVTAAPGTTPLGDATFGSAQYSVKTETMLTLADWLDTMSEISGLQFVYPASASKGDDGVSFSASAHLKQEMQSGRCQGEGSKCP